LRLRLERLLVLRSGRAVLLLVDRLLELLLLVLDLRLLELRSRHQALGVLGRKPANSDHASLGRADEGALQTLNLHPHHVVLPLCPPVVFSDDNLPNGSLLHDGDLAQTRNRVGTDDFANDVAGYVDGDVTVEDGARDVNGHIDVLSDNRSGNVDLAALLDDRARDLNLDFPHNLRARNDHSLHAHTVGSGNLHPLNAFDDGTGDVNTLVAYSMGPGTISWTVRTGPGTTSRTTRTRGGAETFTFWY